MVDRGYTKDSDQVKLGPIELAVENKEMVNIPIWSGVAVSWWAAALLFVRK